MPENKTGIDQEPKPAIDYDAYINSVTEETTDPIEKLQKKAQENLDRINGIPGVQHILKAFKEKDDSGKRMSVIEIRKSYFDLEKQQATHGYSMLVSMEPEVQLEKSGGYTTVVLKFDHGRDTEMSRIWNILEDYGKEQAELPPDADEVPVISITAIPLLLGGQYGMAAHDPIFYHMQPSDVMQEYCDQIRIVFEPGSVAFLRDDTFISAEVLKEVKEELAVEQMTEEARLKKQMEDEAYMQERNKELEEQRQREREKRYRFDASENIDDKFRDSTGLRGE